jgi:phosphohistidine phosphatase SixA
MRKIYSQLGLMSLLLGMALVSTCALAASPAAPRGPHIVMIIRHAEKPEDAKTTKNPDLSPKGYQRAQALAKVIPDHFPKPDYLIATKRSKNSNRPVETITPLAKALHEPIEAKFKDAEYEQEAHAVLTDAKYAGKVVLIAWHHGKIPELAKALGVKDAPDKWNDNVFDRVWEITYEDGVAHFKDLPEDALPGDSGKTAVSKGGR